MSKRPEIDPEDSFALELLKRHEEIIHGTSCEELPDSEDPLVHEAIPVLNLIEEVRRFQHSISQSLVDTPRGDSASGSEGTPVLGPNYGEAMQVGRFAIHEQLGQGGFGVVFRGTDTQLNRQVAVKIPRFEASLSSESRRRFAREAKAAAALNHSNIVGIYETGTDQGVDYIVCELVDGRDLSHMVAEEGSLEPNAAAELVKQLADGLHHAHSRGVLHRDLKPSNVLIENGTGHPRISDFGLASIVNLEQDVTQTGTSLGTPAYMSPEQISAKPGSIGPATDVYGLGAVLFFALCGKAPFKGDSPIETMRAVAEDEPPGLRSTGTKIPRDLVAICQKCLEKRATHRYASANDLRSDLQRYLDGRPVLARPITALGRTQRWAFRNPLIVLPLAAAVICLLSALVATGYGLYATNQSLVATRQSEQQSREDYQELKGFVDTYFREIESDPELKNSPGTESLRQRLLGNALAYYERFLERQPDDEDLLARELADTELRIGRILIDLRRPNDAIVRFASAKQRLSADAFADDATGNPNELFGQADYQLAVASIEIGEADRAQAYIVDAIEAFRTVLAKTQDVESKERLARALRMSCRIHRELRQHPDAIAHGQEAVSLFHELTQAVGASGEARLSLLFAMGELALAHKGNGNLQGEAIHQQIGEEAKTIVDQNPHNWQAAELLILSTMETAKSALGRRENQQAKRLLLDALLWSERLTGLHPGVKKYLAQQAGLNLLLAVCYNQEKDSKKAEELFESNVAIFRALAADDQAAFHDHLRFVGAVNNLVTIRDEHGLPRANNRVLIDEALPVAQRCYEQQPKDEHAQLALVGLHQCKAWEAEKDNDIVAAIDQLGIALQHIEDLRIQGAKHPQTIAFARMIHHNHARLLESKKRYAEALQDRVRSAEYAQQTKDARTANLELTLAYVRLGLMDKAKATFTELDLNSLLPSESILLARLYALRHQQSPASESNWAESALEILSELASSKYFDARREELSDADFSSIREMPPFQSLLSQVLAK